MHSHAWFVCGEKRICCSGDFWKALLRRTQTTSWAVGRWGRCPLWVGNESILLGQVKFSKVCTRCPSNSCLWFRVQQRWMPDNAWTDGWIGSRILLFVPVVVGNVAFYSKIASVVEDGNCFLLPLSQSLFLQQRLVTPEMLFRVRY